jgi:hypothetical protein
VLGHAVLDVALRRPSRRSVMLIKRLKHVLKGVPDIIVIVPPHGHFVGLQVKRQDGRQSPEQKEFEAAATAPGAAYRMVRSVEDVQAALALQANRETATAQAGEAERLRFRRFGRAPTAAAL